LDLVLITISETTLPLSWAPFSGLIGLLVSIPPVCSTEVILKGSMFSLIKRVLISSSSISSKGMPIEFFKRTAN
jgi:hypothetical protein